MAVAFVATSATVYATSTSQNVNIPTVSVGDLLIATIMHRDTLTPETGWDLVATQIGLLGSLEQTLSLYKRIAQGGDSGSSTTWTQATNQRIATNITAFSGDSGLGVFSSATAKQDDTTTTDFVDIAELISTNQYMSVAAATTALYSGTTNAAPSVPSVWALLSPVSISNNRLGIAYKNVFTDEVLTGAFTFDNIAGTNGTASITIIISDDSPPADAISTRLTQAAYLVLTEGNAATRVTQSVFMVLHAVTPPVRITQSPFLVLAEFDAMTRNTQAVMLALVDHVACITKWAQTWTITRTDGQVFAFTSLDRDLTFKGVVHKACDSLLASSTEMSSALGSVGSMELAGIISDDAIKDEELYNGLFDGAVVEVWVVPWENSGGELPFRILAGTLGDVQQGLTSFSAEIVTPGAIMKQKPLVEVVTPGCRYELGDTRCAFDLSTLEVSGSVTGVLLQNTINAGNKRIFIDSTRTEDDRHFEYGEITWTSGDNVGLSTEIKDFSSGTFTLWTPLLHKIVLGDTYTARPGCDKTVSVCKAKFDNFVNYGGFPDVPGQDQIIKAPDSK